MRQTVFKNILNGEEVVCDDVKHNVEVIDGIEYLIVHRKNNSRIFKMRKDVLAKVEIKSNAN